MAAPAAPIQRGPIVCLRYSGAAPMPHAPYTGPNPDELFEISVKDIEMKDAARIAAAAAESEKAKGGGFMSSVSAFASKAVAAVDTAAHQGYAAAERKVRDYEKQRGVEQFTLGFPELAAAGDKLWCHYSCGVLSMGKLIQGTIFISSRNVCFLSDTLKDVFPMTMIASVQRSVGLETQDQGPPFILPLPAPHVMPNVIQLFLTDCKVIQFCDWTNVQAKVAGSLGTGVYGRAVDRAYMWLDRAWRSATQVPLPGVTYA